MAVEVGVVEHDRGRLAAELERDPLELLAADGGDLAAGRGRAGERDLVDARVRDEVLADLAAGGDDVDDAGGYAGLREQLGQQVAVERRLGRRLHHDRAAGQQRRDQLGHDRELRDVPRRDRGDHADRLAAYDDRGAQHAGAAPPPTGTRGRCRGTPRSASTAPGDWARLENDVGEPISRVIRSAISAIFPAYSPEKAWTTSIRSCGDIRGHGPVVEGPAGGRDRGVDVADRCPRARARRPARSAARPPRGRRCRPGRPSRRR